MNREFHRLEDGPFDLLVIGGGVYGTWIAYDAALRGLNVALVERDDWAAATSSSSSKLIHGGLRYLEYFQFGLVRKTLDERRRLARLAAHHVRPQRFVIPSYAGDRVGRLRMRLGLWLYDRLAGRDQPVGPHRVLRRDELLARFPFLRADGARGGFTYGDCRVDDARFTVEVVSGAAEAGAVALNRAAARQLLFDGERVVGAVVEDLESGKTLEVRSTVTLDCTGPWSGGLPGSDGEPADSTVRRTKGVHLVMPRLPVEEAFLVGSPADGRIVFLIPWYGRTLLGTTDTDFDGDPQTARVEPADVAYLLGVANRVLGGLGWRESDVIASYCGLRTFPAHEGKSPSAIPREWILREPAPGLLATVGGKYTSARADAGVAVDRVLERLGRTPAGCPTDDLPLPWCPRTSYGAWMRGNLCRGLSLGMDEATIENCARRYGTSIETLFSSIEARPDLAQRIVPDAPFCRGEIVHAARHEMARTLEDVLRRRVPLLLLARLDQDTMTAAAELAGEELGWSAERRCAEVHALVSRHAPARVHETA